MDGHRKGWVVYAAGPWDVSLHFTDNEGELSKAVLDEYAGYAYECLVSHPHEELHQIPAGTAMTFEFEDGACLVFERHEDIEDNIGAQHAQAIYANSIH